MHKTYHSFKKKWTKEHSSDGKPDTQTRARFMNSAFLKKLNFIRRIIKELFNLFGIRLLKQLNRFYTIQRLWKYSIDWPQAKLFNSVLRFIICIEFSNRLDGTEAETHSFVVCCKLKIQTSLFSLTYEGTSTSACLIQNEPLFLLQNYVYTTIS